MVSTGASDNGDSSGHLASVARHWLDGSVSAIELHQAFLGSTVFLQAGERPGLLALAAPPDGLVAVWTSESEFVRSAGATAWFSMTGADLLSLLPAGYDLLIDPDGDAALRLRTSAVTREAAVTVDWR